MGCFAVVFAESPGPILVRDSEFKVGGFAFFSTENGTLARHQNITFQRNIVRGVLEYARGTPYYTATNNKVVKTRQMFELKTGDRVRVTGNVFDGLPVSATPVSPAVLVGTQMGATTGVNVTSLGILTIPIYRADPVSTVNEDRILVSTYGTPGGIFRVASKSGRTINLKNVDGSAYSGGTLTNINVCNIDGNSHIADVEVSGNTFRRVQTPFQAFGNSFGAATLCMPKPISRVTFQNNISELEANGQTDGARPPPEPYEIAVTAAWIRSFVDGVNFRHNTARALRADPAANALYNAAFWSDDNNAEKNTGLSMTDNILPATGNGAVGDDTGRTGSTMLAWRWPNGYTWAGNAYVRTGGTIAGEPAGSTFPSVSGLGWAHPATGDYRYLKTSAYRTNTSDGYPAGADLRAIDEAQGRVANVRATAAGGSLTVRWSYDGVAPCTVDVSNDNWTTYTRGISAASTRQQSRSFTLAAGTWLYQVLCPGTVDSVATSTILVP